MQRTFSQLLFCLFIFVFLIACEEKRTQENQPVLSEPWLAGFTKHEVNPVLVADSSFTFLEPISGLSVQWMKADVFNPAAVVREDTLFLLFRAEDNPEAILGRRTSRIGLAKSVDGVNFAIHANPILYPASDDFQEYDFPGGVEDPRVVELPDGRYLMLYTSWNYETARLSAAVSADLYTWQKTGPVFELAHEGQFKDIWSKSGAVITELSDGRLLAKEMDGKYWMYWGEDFVNLAWSENLADWYPLLDGDGELLRVMETRTGKYDSRLVEPGPPALATADGIILFYNGKNAEDDSADSGIPRGMYSGAQALFSLDDPSKLISVMDTPFIQPDLPHEITGQYASGTTFIEGLVLYKNTWFLYYGTADSMVGLATAPFVE